MQFLMALEIMQTAEAGLADFAFVGLFLAMCEEVALEVMVPCEVSIAEGAFVTPLTA